MEAAAAAAGAAGPPAAATSQSSRWNFGKKRRQQRNHGVNNGYGSFAGADARRTPEALLDLPRGSPLDERSQLLGAADHDDDDDDDDDAAAQQMEEGSSSSPHIVIAGFEMALRLLVLLAALFWMGTMLPGQAMRAARILEYAVVAWGTIMALRLLVVMYTNKANRPPRTSSSASSTSCCRRLWLYDRNGKRGLNDRAATTTAATILEDEENALLLDEDDAMEGMLDRDEHVTNGGDRGLDPSLAALHMVDTMSRARAIFNDKETPLPLETDYFSGHMLAFIRQPGGGGGPPYFYGKQRRFEFQYQVVLKRVPDGVVYFGCSLQHPLKLNLMQRTLVNAAMAFCRASNPDLAYTLGGDHPYMAFPVVTVRNGLVLLTSSSSSSLLPCYTHAGLMVPHSQLVLVVLVVLVLFIDYRA
jgi:hypothetical protein